MFSFKELTYNDKSRLRGLLNRYNIPYVKLYNNQVQGNDITIEHVYELYDRMKDNTNFLVKPTLKWLKEFMKEHKEQ